MRAAAVMAAAVVVLAGCGGDSDSDSDSAAPAATVPKATTTSPSTTASAGAEDFDQILRDLLARRDEAYEQNDAAIFDEIYSPKCPCLARARQGIAEQRAEGVVTAGERQRVVSVAMFNRPSDTSVVVRAVLAQGPNNLVREDGTVVRPGETEPPTSYVFGLELIAGSWRVSFIEREGPVEP